MRALTLKRVSTFFLFLFFFVALTACDPRRDYEAALLLADISAGSGPSRLKSTTPLPGRIAVRFPGTGRTKSGDLYLSNRPPLAAILLLPGAAERGKDDPRLIAFATSLARARFAVLVPDMEDFRSLKVGSGDIDDTAAVFAWLISKPQLAPQGRAGLVSFSYASGPALLASLKPPARGRVRFIMAIGGYHSLNDVLIFFTTGYFKAGEKWLHREPNAYGKWVFVESNISRLSDAGDRMLFAEIARRRLADLNAPVSDLVARLTPEGRTLLAFIENRDPGRAPLLMARLPASIRGEIAALDVARHDLSGLTARLILIHGYDDDIIPYTESVALSRQAPRGEARLYLVHGLKHVTLGPHMLMDTFRLWRGIVALLAEREGGAG